MTHAHCFRSLRVLLATLALFAAVSARGEEPRPAYAQIYGWSRVAFGGPPTDVRFGGGVETRLPVPIGDGFAFGEISVRVEITSLPEKSAFTFEDLGSWGDAAELGGAYDKAIGRLDVGPQKIRLAVAALGSFATQVGEDDGVTRRFSRRIAGGIRFEEETSRSSIFVGFGTDEGVGPGWRHLVLEGAVTIYAPLRFYARAGLDVGPPTSSNVETQTDYFNAGIGAYWGNRGNRQ